MSAPVEIQPHPTKGRALHATKPFHPGDLIACFSPLLLLPSLSHLAVVCTYCLKPGTPRACTRCRAVYYCDAVCQTAGWKGIHGRECKVLQRLGDQRGAQLPTPVRVLIQALLSPALDAGISGLEGHVAQRRAGPGWADLEVMAMGACSFAGKGSGEAVVKKAVGLLCKIQTNAFHRYDADLGQVGVFLEPTLAMANHSCVPNAMVQFIGRTAILRAETKIEAGREIEISYTDYTYPLSKRKEALAPYQFECWCERCKDNLNVYQVCAQFPRSDANLLSLVPDISAFQQHPAAIEPNTISVARTCGETVAPLVESGALPEPLSDRWQALKSQYQQCKGLISNGLWAVSPVPQILTEMSIYYAEKADFVSALTIACHVTMACDPYRYTAPFHPVRIKNIFIVVKLLSNTAAATASMSQSVTLSTFKADIEQKALQTLRDIDQVSLCQMLLVMILKWTPRGLDAESELSLSARDIMDDIERLPGREKELSLINAWRRDPDDSKSRAFFDYAVIQQMRSLADLGRAALQLEVE